jgi:hypothetical protein
VLREDQSQGQRIRTWALGEISTLSDGAVLQLGNGTSVGNRKVALFKAPVTVAGLKLTVTTAGGAPPVLSLFGVYKPCPSQ